MKINFTLFWVFFLSILLQSCGKGKYMDPSTKIEYNLPEGVSVTNQSMQQVNESMYRFSFEGNESSGKVFHKENAKSSVSFDVNKIMEIEDSLLFDDMGEWLFDSIDAQYNAKVYHSETGTYRKNYYIVHDDGADFIEVVKPNCDFSDYDDTICKTKVILSWWIIALLLVIGIVMLICSKKYQFKLVILEAIPVHWLLIGFALLAILLNLL